jgi:hypothetical protein
MNFRNWSIDSTERVITTVVRLLSERIKGNACGLGTFEGVVDDFLERSELWMSEACEPQAVATPGRTAGLEDEVDRCYIIIFLVFLQIGRQPFEHDRLIVREDRPRHAFV